MKLIATYSVRPGQKLAKPVVNKNGMVMLGAGTELTDKYIDRLRKMGVADIYVEDEEQLPAAPFAAYPVEHKRAAPKGDPALSRKAAEQKIAEMKSSSVIRQMLSVPMLGDQFLRIFQDLLGEVAGHPYVMEQLSQLHLKDPSLFEHTVKVATLSSIIGFAKKYDSGQLYELAVSSMLFDIGMTGLPDSLLTKRGGLTALEREKLQDHTKIGYRTLAGRTDIPPAASLCALQHHERYDGSGYPAGIRHVDIIEFAQIIAIADIYDALVSKRYHRKPYAPGDAIEFLLGSGDRMFNLSLVKLFVNHISIYPIGSRVILNSGQTAVITSVDSSFVQRPVVKIIQERDGSHVVFPYEIDLKVQLELVIVDMLVHDENHKLISGNQG